MRKPLKITEDQVDDVLRTIQALAKKEVLIGIPDATADRPGGEEVTNAELGYLNEFGSPANNIPARPFLIPGVTRIEQQAAVLLRKGAEHSLDTGASAVPSLDAAGQLAENSVKRWFTDPANGWAPNTPSTIRKKGSNRPLIDTGELRRSVTHVVVDKK
jgi:hypothetical protein